MEGRAARLRDAAHVHAAGAVLGRKVRALHLHFLNHVVVQGYDDAAVAADVDKRGAIERDGVARRPDAVHRIRLGVVAAPAEADRLPLVEVGDDSRQDAEQLERTAADNREVLDLFRSQHTLAGAGFRLDDFLLPGDGHCLGLLADFEPHVDAAVVARADNDPPLLVRLEARELDPQVVVARKEAREQILAALVADVRLGGLRADVDQCDRGPWEHAAGRVLNAASYRAGCGTLRERARCGE